MPFLLVITKEGGSDAVTAVPSGWVVNDTLYWPRTAKKTEIEALRSNEHSQYSHKWRKQKCRIKVKDISSFHEATKMEEMYAGFEDTEDEQAYFRKQQDLRKHPTHKFTEFIDLNTEFINTKMNVQDENDTNSQIEKNQNVDTLLDTQNCNTSSEKQFTICETELLTLIENNNVLSEENKTLKQDQKRLEAETKRLETDMKRLEMELYNNTRDENNLNNHVIDRYEIIQIKLDKIINMMLVNTQSKEPEKMAIDGDEETITDNFTFPIASTDELERLEAELTENNNLENKLVKKFSKIFGKGGEFKCAKIGLSLMKHIITDELLSKCSWKGIKGTQKTAFMQFTRIKNLIYNVMKLADRSCTITQVEAFLQHSAIKHSAQRIKRKRDDKVETGRKKHKAPSNISSGEKETSDISSMNNNIQNISQEEIEKNYDKIESETDEQNTVITLTKEMITIHQKNDD